MLQSFVILSHEDSSMQNVELSYAVNLDFEVIKLPPVTDILVVGKKVPQGKNGILRSFDLILPDVFELIDEMECNHENVEAVIINKSILTKLPKSKVISILKEYVFPYVTKGESVKVNFNVRIFYRNISGDLTTLGTQE